MKGKPVAGAAVFFQGSLHRTLSDSSGMFSLSRTDTSGQTIVVLHEDYLPDTVDVGGKTFVTVLLTSFQTLSGAGVTAGRDGRSRTGLQTIKTEIITQGELKKAACCDLAGCFETQGTVQPVTTNIITNSKELRILGLSGAYNQVLTDGIPLIQGLSYTYGISSIPGTLVDNIYVSKGTSSVLQGFESMVGQINVLPKSPDKGERLLLNSYVNSFGENHYNGNFRIHKKKWSNLISGHSVQPAAKRDKDYDGFLDLPRLKRYMLYDKLKLGDENRAGLSTVLGLRALWEQRSGGQWQYNHKTDTGSTRVYGQHIAYSQYEAYSKSAFKFSSGKQISLMASGLRHKQKSWFGTAAYQALQNSAYANLQYETDWRSHEFKAGMSYRYLRIAEDIRFTDTLLKRSFGGRHLKLEQIPGVFAENTFRWRGDLITLITGFRADYHPQFGWQYTPRAMFKYDITREAVIRASAGTGWRTVNLFSENTGLLASSRDIVITETLRPEKAFNYGVNLLQKYKFGKAEGFFTVDAYQTRFSNQIFPDYDADPAKAYVSNFSGTSVSNGFQTDVQLKLYKHLETKLAYNFLDVYRVVNGLKQQLPFNSRHKLLLSFSWGSLNKKWRADVNAHRFGRQRLPDTQKNPEEFRQADYSKGFTLVNAQITRSWKKLEVYAGCENIFGFRQLRPIVSWQNPFSPYFDTSFNWGPNRGRELYIGVRYKPF